MNFWQILGIEPTADTAAIRHAYAEKTRACHPEEDPEGFDRLHTAFSEAMQYARRARRPGTAAPRPEKAPGGPAPAAPAVTGSRESCLAAEQAAYLEWMKKNGSAARQAGGSGEFDFTAADAGGRRAPAREKEPKDGEEEPQPSRAARPAAPPEQQFDFDHLPEQVSRQRRQRAQALVEQLCSARGAGAWRTADLLAGEEFRTLQHTPEFLEQLVQMLQKEPACLDKLAMDLIYAYDLPGLEKAQRPAPDAAHEALFALLRPRWQAHCQAQQEREKRRSAGATLAFVLGLWACVSVSMLGVFNTLPPYGRWQAATACGALAAFAAWRVRASGKKLSTATITRRCFQLLLLGLLSRSAGLASAGGLLSCFVAAALPGLGWFRRRSRRIRLRIAALCALLVLLWPPVSLLALPAPDFDALLGRGLSWFAMPCALISCVLVNYRVTKQEESQSAA